MKIQKKNFFWGGGGRGVSWRGRVGGGVRVDVNKIEVFVKIQKKIFWGGSVGGSGSGWGVRVDVNEELSFGENSKKKKFFGGGFGGGVGGGGGRWGVGVGLGVQSGCERRIEVFVKIQKKNFFCFFGGGAKVGGSVGGVGLVGGGVRVDVNEELKFL